MERTQKNKMAEAPMKKLLLKMGLPMIISMVLQALYNVIDSIFVANMGEQGAIANQALTLAFPIQILIIAIGVGTEIGLNALLSKSLGEKNQEKVNKVAGNGIFLSICIFIVFLLFGLFGSQWFISLFAGGNQEVISMGTIYLKICICLSLGSIGISREHGTGGKEIARRVAEKLELKFFDKEEIKKFAIENSLIENKHNDDELYKFYLSLDAEKDSMIKQAKTIKLIASKNDCVIVGRCADYIK